jgi:hypothetical protein
MTAHTSGLRQPPARPPGDSTICHKGLSQARKVPVQSAGRSTSGVKNRRVALGPYLAKGHN